MSLLDKSNNPCDLIDQCLLLSPLVTSSNKGV